MFHKVIGGAMVISGLTAFVISVNLPFALAGINWISLIISIGMVGCSIGMIAVGRDFIIGKYKDGTND